MACCQSDSHRWQARPHQRNTSQRHTTSTCYGTTERCCSALSSSTHKLSSPQHPTNRHSNGCSNENALREVPTHTFVREHATSTSSASDRSRLHFWGERLNRPPPAWSIQRERGSGSTSIHGEEPDP